MEFDEDRVIRGFRWVLAAGALLQGILLGQGEGLVVAGVLAIVNFSTQGLGSDADRRVRHGLEVAIDLALVIWIVAVVQPVGNEPLWALLALPIVEGSVRFQMRGALAVWCVGEISVLAIMQTTPTAESLIRQATVLGVAVAVGLVSRRLEGRLLELEQSQAESNRRATLLNAVATSARTVTSLEPDRVLEAVTESALLLGFDMAEISIADPVEHQLVPVVQRGWPEHHPTAGQPWDSGCAGRAYTTGETVLVADYPAWEFAVAMHVETAIARSAAAAPVVVGGLTLAVLTVANRDARTVTLYEQECLELLATQAGVALRNARLYDQRRLEQEYLEHQANHDALTGLANRNHFLAKVEERMAPTATARDAIVVLFVDLDGFKEVNDTYGHATGDALLKVIAARLDRGLRPDDLVGRHGGDEFTVLLDHAPSDPGVVANRLLQTLMVPTEVCGHILVPSASIGIAIETDGDDVDRLLKRADQAMYRAKLAGRGQHAM